MIANKSRKSMNCKNELLTPLKVFNLHYPVQNLVIVLIYQFSFSSGFFTEAPLKIFHQFLEMIVAKYNHFQAGDQFCVRVIQNCLSFFKNDTCKWCMKLQRKCTLFSILVFSWLP